MYAYIDCLTDGSEYTGGPAIFLTLRKTDENGPILARYNLSGIPSLTGRLASDQSYQLLSSGCFRCVLLPSLDNTGGFAALFLSLVQYGYKVLAPTTDDGDGSGSDSESSMEDQNNATMSYGDISIIGPEHTSALVDGVLDVIFGDARKRPSVRLCEVPLKDGCWWDVYQDEYVRIWAQSVDYGCSTERKRKRTDSSCTDSKIDLQVVYMVMIKPYHQMIKSGDRSNQDPISFAILPHTQYNDQSSVWNALRNLPQEIIDATRKRRSHHLDFILHLQPDSIEEVTCTKQIATENNSDIKSSKARRCILAPQWVMESKLSEYHFSTIPDTPKDGLDPGILIRAQRRSRLLNKHIPFAFPLSDRKRDIVQNISTQEDGCAIHAESFQLQSCSSVLINGDADVPRRQPFTFISRIEQIISRRALDQDEYESKPSISPEVMLLLKQAYSRGTENEELKTAAAADDNEIDLDDHSDSDNDEHVSLESDVAHLDPTTPHLLLLGTGCATPSPLRGSSSYALFLPASVQTLNTGLISTPKNSLVLSAIIECGEGTLTSLSRHILDSGTSPSVSLQDHLKWVQLIWISHSHLDHYGDVSSVIQAIASAKKRHSTPHNQPVVVIAPSKVLKFLNVTLGSPRNNVKHPSHIGITHREFQSSPFASNIRSMIFDYVLPNPFDGMAEHLYRPFASLRNVEVEHCREAFALILELRVPIKGNGQKCQPFVLCFSGDTRPSGNLIQACRSHCPSQLNTWKQTSIPPPPPPRISLLLHEATFIHDEHGKRDAVKKRHSTTAEALDVAKSMQVEACLLTHFSQRYAHVSVGDAVAGKLHESNTFGSSDKAASATSYSFPWGIGIDGMVIPLKKEATSQLHHLSQCVDTLLSKNERVSN